MSVAEQSGQNVPPVDDAAPQLSLLANPQSPDSRKIECHRVVTLIGSRSGCKVTLNHACIASVHAALINTGHSVVAVELLTNRGALLNGLKMKHEVLSDGDILGIYPWEFRVAIGTPARRGNADVHTSGLEPTPSVVALEHLETGRVLKPNRDVCVLGRRHGCDIHIDDNRVSRAHALLFNYFGRPVIFDLLSRNKTYVNDGAISYHALLDQDVLSIGDSRFRVRLVGCAVNDRVRDDSKPGGSSSAPAKKVTASDLINIESVESAERWRIAEKLGGTAPKSKERV